MGKRSPNMKITIGLFLCFFLLSCSSHKEVKREVREDAAQSGVNSSEKLKETIHELIDHSESFTPEQKAQLHKLFDENKKRALELTAKSYKFRGVLVKELLSGSPSRARVNALKKDIERIEKLRLKNTFDTAKAITDIVRTHPEEDEFTPHIINFEGSPQMLR